MQMYMALLWSESPWVVAVVYFNAWDTIKRPSMWLLWRAQRRQRGKGGPQDAKKRSMHNSILCDRRPILIIGAPLGFGRATSGNKQDRKKRKGVGP